MEEVRNVEKQGRPWWHYFLGCGCIGVIFAGIATAAVLYKGYRAVADHFFMDPVKVDKVASEIFPGAKPFPGHDGTFGMSVGDFRMAVISPPLKGSSQNGLMIMLMDFKNKRVSRDEAKKAFTANRQPPANGATPSPGQDQNQNQNQNQNQETVIETESVEVSLGGKPFKAEKSLVEDSQKRRTTRYSMAFVRGQDSSFIVIEGQPGENFDQKGMDSFLAGLDATGLENASDSSVTVGASASPMPASASPTP